MAIGTAVGGGAVVGFGPVVRSKVEAKAAAYGAHVDVQHVLPSWSGVRLRGVEISLEAMPGVRVWLEDVVVGWGGQHALSMAGGKILAVGPMDELVQSFERWRASRLSGSASEGGGGRPLVIEGFELDWRDVESAPSSTIRATDLRAERRSGALAMSAGHVSAASGSITLEVEGGRVVLARKDAGYRVAELGSDSLAVEYRTGATQLSGGSGDSDAPTALATSAPRASASAAAPGRDGGAGAASEKVAGEEAAAQRRVAAARRVHAWLIALGRRLDELVDGQADIGVHGARARLLFDGEVLNLGPGSLRFAREDGDLIVGLEPEQRGEGESLTFSARIPLVERDEIPADQRSIEARLRGGPVWLSLLGVREGDLGLRDVSRTSLESNVTVQLPADGETLTLDGSGKLHQLSLSNARLADKPLEGVELAWGGKLQARLDGSELTLEQAELDLGDIRLQASGSYKRHEGGRRVDLEFEVPLVACQNAFDSIPTALVPRLRGTHLVGSLAAKGHARFDTVNLDKHYDVDWDGSLSCRIVDVPADIAVSRFKKPFEKLVYSPDKDERKMEFGPGTDNWVPLNEISHFMVGAVLTTEDGRFFRHGGFDQEAIVNSIRENLREGRFVRGASTISMQLAKNLYLPRTKTIARKLQEAILTLYLEQELTKNEIMELYLNVIEYGPMVYGVGPGAQHYFNSHPSRLSLGQALYLGSILANPQKQFFGAGGAVIPSHMSYLKKLMKIVNKIGRISDEELDVGLRETVVFGSPSMVAPADDDPYEGDERVVDTQVIDAPDPG